MNHEPCNPKNKFTNVHESDNCEKKHQTCEEENIILHATA